MENRVDESRLDIARGICDAVCDRTEEDGRHHPPEALFAESSAYRSEHAATLAIAGQTLHGVGAVAHPDHSSLKCVPAMCRARARGPDANPSGGDVTEVILLKFESR